MTFPLGARGVEETKTKICGIRTKLVEINAGTELVGTKFTIIGLSRVGINQVMVE